MHTLPTKLILFAGETDVHKINIPLLNWNGRCSLISVDVSNPALSNSIGAIGYNNVYGLAFVDGTMYGASGTDVFQINLSTGLGGTPISFAGQGLGAAWGASPPSPTPEPATILLLSTGLAGLLGFGRKKYFKK